MTKAFRPVVPFDLIQGIRLAHALMESRFEVCIPNQHAAKFEQIERCFEAKYRTNACGVEKLDAFHINHRQPKTSIGSLERSLIFPYAILRHCRTLWSQDRTIHVSFAGLMTDERKAIISSYCSTNFSKPQESFPDMNPLWHRALNRVRNSLGSNIRSRSVKVGDLTLWSSRRGRTFPIKAWDEEYHELLAMSRFVLCPSGDYVWSYRFFESVLCGAIPIVEEPCSAYKDFIFHCMDEPIAELKWDPDVAQHNYDLCISRLSITVDEMESELERILA